LEALLPKGGLMSDILEGKVILIVDDEPDILDSLKELLDIMGVNGLELMELTYEIGIPALILTAHALSSKNFVKALRGGAYAYIPKHEMTNIADFLAEMIEASEIMKAKETSRERPNKWFKKLTSCFDKAFGLSWKDKHKEDLEDLNLIKN
jgi:DNA-binding NtrC family response regulator